MPKELNVSPNQRIDLEDFEYGTRTFTVDSLRAHVTRLMAGGYRGGFVLEGFRVQVTTGSMTVQVTNGIALDRTGRLVTFEEGDYFLNNPLATKPIEVLGSTPNNYLMVEYTLANTDDDNRAFWDPTYPAAAVIDSGGDSVPVPKGKEFDLKVSTRKAQSWTPIISATGFEDTADPNKLRIPIAIIPVDTGTPAIDIAASFLKAPATSIIEKPDHEDGGTYKTIQYLQCADTRIFPATGFVEVQRRTVGASATRTFNIGVDQVTSVRYVSNDRQNNRLYLENNITVAFGNDVDGFAFEEPEIGDVVVQVTGSGITPASYVQQASKYDCRPMFYATTEPLGSRQENATNYPLDADGDRRTDSRQFKYWAGLSLLSDPNASFVVDAYPPLSASFGQSTAVQQPATRIETRIKQNQDFVRVVASLLEEMKYGYAVTRKGTCSEDEVGSTTLAKFGITSAGGLYLVDATATTSYKLNSELFTQDYVGSTVRILSGANVLKRFTISRVYGDGVLELSTAAANPFSAGDQFEVELNSPTDYEQYVNSFRLGSLREIYNARIDQFTGTYAPDLNRRLRSNKTATITVGNGVTTFGDYNGNAGIEAAFMQAYGQKRATTIFIKEGDYLVGSSTASLLLPVGSNTTVVGEGIGRTNISWNSSTPGNEKYIILRDKDAKYATPAASSKSDITVSNVTFKDLTIIGGFSPVFSNCPLEFEDLPGTAGFGAYTAGSWRTKWSSGSNTASPIKNLKFDRVEIKGGSVGSWSTGIDASYAVNIAADNNYHLNTTYNQEIVFNECEFHNYGGAILLNDCLNTSIKDCLFESGGLFIEGITVCSRTARFNNLQYIVTTNDNLDGNLNISGCSFVGRSYNEPSATNYPADNKRGWINFTPTYTGVNNSVTDCIFSPNYKYSVTTTTQWPLRANQINPDWHATGILKCNVFDLSVNDCKFTGVQLGIIHNYGVIDVTNCSFNNVYKALISNSQLTEKQWNFGVFSGGIAKLENDNYWALVPTGPSSASVSGSSYWGNGDAPVKVLVKDSYFTGAFSGNTVGGVCSEIGVLAVAPARLQAATGGASNTGLISSAHNSLYTTFQVLGCTFNSIPYGLTMDSLKMGSADNLYTSHTDMIRNWDLVEISDCDFVGVNIAVVGGASDWWDATGANKEWDEKHHSIYRFLYTNNKHSFSDFENTSGSAYVTGSSTHTTVTNNTFSEIRSHSSSAGSLNPIVEIQSGQQGLNFSNNNFWDCYPAQDNNQITMLHVSIWAVCSGELPNTVVNSYGTTFTIHNNVFKQKMWTNTSSYTGRVANGVYVDPFYKGTIPGLSGLVPEAGAAGVLRENAIGEPYHPALSLKNNDLHLINGNFGLCSVQHYGFVDAGTGAGEFTSGYANIWAWLYAQVCDNNIYLDIRDVTNNYQYGNDYRSPLQNVDDIDVGGGAQTYQTYVNYNFLGCSNNSIPDYYYACVDLRSMFKDVNTAFTNTTANPNVVSGNTFVIANNNLAPAWDPSPDVVERIGLRVSKFPAELAVKNNTFNAAPLILRWTWNNPYHTTSSVRTPGLSSRIGFTFNITNNSFLDSVGNLPLHVDVNPAIGFGSQVGADKPVVVDPGTLAKTVFHNNSITNKSSCIAGPYDSLKGMVRFWFPELNSWVGPNNVGAATVPSALNALFTNWLANASAGGTPGGFGWGQFYAPAMVDVRGNSLENSYFIITKQADGGDSAGNELDTTLSANMYHFINIDDTFLSNNQTSVTGTEATAVATSLLGHWNGATSAPVYGETIEKKNGGPGTGKHDYFIRVGTTVCILGRTSTNPIKIVNGVHGQVDGVAPGALTNDVEIKAGGSYIDGMEN